jgi:hypothetical protein
MNNLIKLEKNTSISVVSRIIFKITAYSVKNQGLKLRARNTLRVLQFTKITRGCAS